MGETALAQGTVIALRLGRGPLTLRLLALPCRRSSREIPVGAHLHQIAYSPRPLPRGTSGNRLEDRRALRAGAHLRPGQIAES